MKQHRRAGHISWDFNKIFLLKHGLRDTDFTRMKATRAGHQSTAKSKVKHLFILLLWAYAKLIINISSLEKWINNQGNNKIIGYSLAQTYAVILNT